MIVEIYDLETLINCFTYTGFCIQDQKWYQFVIHKDRDDRQALYDHLKRDNKMLQVGFNNENFDYPIEHYFLLHFDKMMRTSSQDCATMLYSYAQYILNNKYNTIWDSDKLIQQMDLYLIWHYNNVNRRTSLKDLEFAMHMENIQEMPIKHDEFVTYEQIPLILDYNKNDVEATKRFLYVTLGQTDYSLYKNKSKYELRQSISKKFNVSAMNWSDVKIGEQLMLTLYCRETGRNRKEVKDLRTYRTSIKLSDCIPSWCKIETKEFQEFIDTLNKTIITSETEFATSVIYHGISFDFGLGGSHGCIKSGIYEADDYWTIMDLDVTSLYPSIAKSLNLYPAHLGPAFMKLYVQFLDARIAEKAKPKDQQDIALIEGYKLLLNGTYGKSNEPTSFMYDPLYTYKTTIAGQLFISMWAERIVKYVPELIFIQINTDGITIKVPRDKIDLINKACQELTDETTLGIETAFYDKMVVRDVNNYVARYEESDKIKYKGAFEIDKEYHKDSSMRIVPIAIKAYFFDNIPIEETIRNHTDIFDFCMRLKINSATIGTISYLNGYEINKEFLHRTTRYYVSNSGGGITVYYNGSNKPTRINKGKYCTIFNIYEEKDFKEYDIDYDFYITEARKIIDSTIDYQLGLF